MSGPRLKFARSKRDIERLCQVDVASFPASDAFAYPFDWVYTRNYLLYNDDSLIGSTALNLNEYWDQELSKYVSEKGCLYIASTAVLPQHQGRGWGNFFKRWQLKYAKRHRCHVIRTSTRESNMAMRRLNEKFGFKVARVTSVVFENPDERSVDMELRL